MKELTLTVFEPGEMVGTLSNGKVALWSVDESGMWVSADNRLFPPRLTSATPVEELGLSVRPYNALKREGINTFGELLELYDRAGVDGLHDMRNMGQNASAEIVDIINRLRPEGSTG